MKKSMKAITAVVISAAVALSACSVEDVSSNSDGKHLNLELVYHANTEDPHLVAYPFFLNSGALETLVAVNPDTKEIEPKLATSWESEDAQHWTFQIRENVTFHNGTALDAEVVKANIESAIAANPALAKTLNIESMTAQGHKLEITTTTQYASLPSQFAHYNAVIVDPNANESYPVGTGAFKFTSFSTTGDSELVRFEDYWDGIARLDSVTLSANEDVNSRLLALQSGQVDIAHRLSLENIDSLRNIAGIEVETVPGTRTYDLMYNLAGSTNGELFNKLEFRKGIDALLDRESMVNTILKGNGEIGTSPMPEGFPVTPDVVKPVYGESEARAFFEAAGVSFDNGVAMYKGQPLHLKIATYNSRPELPQIAQTIQDAAKNLGMSMEIVLSENIDEYLAAGDWDIATYSMSTLTRGDGSYFVNSSYLPDGALNYGKVNDPALTAMIEQFNATIDPEQRIQRMRDIAAYIRDNVLGSYVLFINESAGFKNTVRGWVTPSNDLEFAMVTKDLDVES
ncbi:ABC transporter substrate-binding protein [Corynebacterium kutscheri]|uniref:ABC-type dipeptide transport system, periplasmic component n=1 Tax=Corynebacterium kutscheri TaxID=35755 RepID=A0A0F6R007_9CORY|nr:ABC transporter substrate-binding protein [Corynebacterium kutscheri]AKE41020.1 ABC-type dipeptide transport system, periplasmic component [Corynebacterium kutscheri]VEH06910.1 MFS-type drug efflux transporter [Corynebacterium kutscheri]VEH09318.1 MFS-type drug efflux transporter [Corynebacterium kutscheri]